MKEKSLIFLVLSLLIVGCRDVFDVHPYDVDFTGETNINARNMALIEERFQDKDTLRVAFVSDSHLWLSDFKAMVRDINRRGEADFVIHCGDITDTGTTKEFCWARDILRGLAMPYVVLIGNHDFLGTGNQTFRAMFGDFDFSFIAGRIKFVCLNTNAAEYSYMAAVPDFNFLESQMTEDSARFDRSIVVMHAKPYSDQFNNNVAKAFEAYLQYMPGLMFCVNGHDHVLVQEDLFGDGLVYYGVDSAEHRNYYLFTITKEGYSYEVVYY